MVSARLRFECFGERDAAGPTRLQAVLDRAFDAGSAEAYMDWYHLGRERWFEALRA